ncbi:hypothetical protein D3C71_1309470 [compost metagenome]
MMSFIEDQQQVFWVRQHRFALKSRHHQRVVGHHHFRFLNLAARHEEWAFAVVVAIAVQAAGFVGAQTSPQVVADGFIRMIAQAVPLIAVKIDFKLCAQLLLGFVVRR